jgi:hypothetical protein
MRMFSFERGLYVSQVWEPFMYLLNCIGILAYHLVTKTNGSPSWSISHTQCWWVTEENKHQDKENSLGQMTSHSKQSN